MRHQGSEAYSVEMAERRRERLERQAAPSFEVVTGGGLDARARAGVSPVFVSRVRAVLACAAVLIVLGMARVGLTAATVSLMSSNSDLSTQIEETTSLNEQLKVQRSVLSSNARITRIATENYGMVLTADAVTIDVSEPEQVDAVDGDAAQTADAASAQADMA